MPRYKVPVTMTMTTYTEVEVEANNMAEAKEAAESESMELAHDPFDGVEPEVKAGKPVRVRED